MLNLSIMPLDNKNVNAVCDDIIEQQRKGVSTHAMFCMTFHAEGNPGVNKASSQCEIFDKYKQILDKNNAKYGILAQSTLGHFAPLSEQHPFQTLVSLDGEPYKTASCPLDKNFQKYIKGQMKIIASHGSSIILIDDDVGIIYKIHGCTCPLHMAEFNKRAKTNFTREELKERLVSNLPEDKKYVDIFVEVQKDSLLEIVNVMREGIDEVDPKIWGAISGICPGDGYVEFSDVLAPAFAGKGNPVISRLNGGIYTMDSRGYTPRMYRSALIRESLKGKADYILAETDTCPQNRYSASASLLHMHFTASIFEGANGAKHWITKLNTHEPNSGRQYRKILSKYNCFYNTLVDYVKFSKPVGCRIPLCEIPSYPFTPWGEPINNIVAWSTSVLEHLGLPLYFSNEKGGAVFIDDITVGDFTDDTFKEFFKGTLVLSGKAAKKLNDRGFGEYTGVSVSDWKGKLVSYENIDDCRISKQYRLNQLTPINNSVDVYSMNYNSLGDNLESLFPAVTGYKNPAGGYTIVFCGSPDAPFNYSNAFSMLNETRKKQLINILSSQNQLPIYYPDDADVYLRASYLDNGELMCGFFNISLDVLDEITLVIKDKFSTIEILQPDGTRKNCEYYVEDGVVHVKEQAGVFLPIIFFIR